MYKKLFFPIGGGGKLKQRIYGALLVAKKLNTHIEILVSNLDAKSILPEESTFPQDLIKKMNEVSQEKIKEDINLHVKIFTEICKELKVEISEQKIKNKTTANLKSRIGYRSKIVAQKSKFCDLVITATPPKGEHTSTFSSAVLKSGKPVLIIPRKLKKFSYNKILIAWNNSLETSRAITLALPFLSKAKQVKIITTKEYMQDNIYTAQNLSDYLNFHDINAQIQTIKPTTLKGQIMLEFAKDNNFNMIIAGSNSTLSEKILGGTTKYLLNNTHIPIFVSS